MKHYGSLRVFVRKTLVPKLFYLKGLSVILVPIYLAC